MIIKTDLNIAIALAKEFIVRAKELQKEDFRNCDSFSYATLSPGHKAASVKRCSMDLTKILAKLRKSN